MNTNTLKHFYTGGTLSIIANGETFNYSVSNQKFAEYLTFAKQHDGKPFDPDLKSKLDAMFNSVAGIKSLTAKLDNKLAIKDGSLFFEEFEIKGNLAERLVEGVRVGNDYKHLINFFYNIQKNPNLASRESAFTFVDENHFPLTDDGCFLGYKAVRNDFTDKYTGKIDNSPGNVVEMDRSKVNANRSEGCSYGLHVGNFEYVQSFGSNDDNWLIVKVNPEDVVSVPTEDCRKVRVCRYEVIASVSKEYELDYSKVYSNEDFNYTSPKTESPDSDVCGEYDEDGYDSDGYNDEGFDIDGYDRDGYDYYGFDRVGYNRDGYDEDGFDREGYDEYGFDCDGYDRDGYDEFGKDVNGNPKRRYDNDGNLIN